MQKTTTRGEKKTRAPYTSNKLEITTQPTGQRKVSIENNQQNATPETRSRSRNLQIEKQAMPTTIPKADKQKNNVNNNKKMNSKRRRTDPEILFNARETQLATVTTEQGIIACIWIPSRSQHSPINTMQQML